MTCGGVLCFPRVLVAAHVATAVSTAATSCCNITFYTFSLIFIVHEVRGLLLCPVICGNATSNMLDKIKGDQDLDAMAMAMIIICGESLSTIIFQIAIQKHSKYIHIVIFYILLLTAIK